MKKNYKDFKKVYLGESDMASLTLRSGKRVCSLDFGRDGGYSAYLCTGDVDIPSYYTEVFSCSAWLKIYDDNGLTAEIRGDCDSTITVYRAGEMGVIVHIYN